MRIVLGLMVAALLGDSACKKVEVRAVQDGAAPATGSTVTPASLLRGPGLNPTAAPASPPQARRVRPPLVAGQFYPRDPAELEAQVRSYLAQARREVETPVRIVLVPHAGYMYSGQIAAHSFRQLDSGFKRAVILAANHTPEAFYNGVSVDRATHYQLPGFEVAVSPAAAALLSRPGFVEVPAAHASHVIEVELPFLREVAGQPFEIVPLIVGQLSRADTGAIASHLLSLAEPKTIFVFSIDLSHYHPYDLAVSKDRSCLSSLVEMDADAIAQCDTDGTHVLLVMTELAARLGLTPRLLAYRNSGDVSGDKSRGVVGYGALVYEERFELGHSERKALGRFARQVVETRVREGREPQPPEELLRRFPRLSVPRAAFVTLKKRGDLRGCIGSLVATRPLAQDVAQNAASAAVRDPRFAPVRPEELGDLNLTVSVLEPPRPLEGLPVDDLPARLGETRPGLILELLGRQSTFLPEVWKEIPDPATFLAHLCQKQGAPPSCWRDPNARFQTYRVQYFREDGTVEPL
jgi:AmmeMemoRadiSam system protein B/AmmeMemoRadiSam system protein A